MRAMLSRGATAADIEAVCYLLSPSKDAQSGGHRLRPDWAPDNKPLGLTHGSINTAVLEATGASRSQLSAAYSRLRDSGDAALEVREGSNGGRQMLLIKPARLNAAGVHKTLLSLCTMSGTGVEKQKATKLAGLLRASVGTELKWLVRSFVPHMSCGISLEASVLPALASAALIHAAHDSAGSSPLPTASALREAQDALRRGYALRPDVRVLVDAILSIRDGAAAASSSDGGTPLQTLCRAFDEVCTLRAGVPSQPMLAKPCTSIADAIKILGDKTKGAVAFCAEHKYDGQRAQIHRSQDGTIRLFSRKLDDMTFKYPDVIAAVKRSAKSARPFIADAEIVAIKTGASPVKAAAAEEEDDEAAAASGGGGGGQNQLGTFQSLSTRKRKGVTTDNAAASSVPVCLVLFDLLMLGEEDLLQKTLKQRRQALHDEFEEIPSAVSFAASTELSMTVDGNGVAEDSKSVEGEIEAALRRSVEDGCEGLMLKRLGWTYDPVWGTRRSNGWVKCKKDYIDGMGDSLDLVPIGGWRGMGRKKKWISPWLMATYDASSGTFGSVCRVMSGFSDKFYKENTIKYLGAEIGVGAAVEEGDGGGEEEDEEGEGEEEEDGDEEEADDGVDDDLEDSQGEPSSLLLNGPASGVETGEQPPYWFRPSEVWELRGADITISPKHMAAYGLVEKDKGLGMRFPRFIRKREDKRLSDATTPEQLVEIFRKQTQGQREA